MSLSRPARLPLLKLPFLCIASVVKNWDTLDIIYFALISKKARQIVKHLKIPLNGMKIFITGWKWIRLNSSNIKWGFTNEIKTDSSFDNVSQYLKEDLLVLRKDAAPLYTLKTDNCLESYSEQNEITALRMAVEFLAEVFKGTVEEVSIDEENFPESGDMDIGVKFTRDLKICTNLNYAQCQQMNLLLENLKVTDTCLFWNWNTEKDFYCDPKVLKCKKLVFWPCASAWVTGEILLQFEVPQIRFMGYSFSVKDIVSFVTQWFKSDNTKLEYLYIDLHGRYISSEKFQTLRLKPSRFNGRNRVPSSDSFKDIDFSKGLEIVRRDGLVATIHSEGRTFLFYIWHDQPAITQN